MTTPAATDPAATLTDLIRSCREGARGFLAASSVTADPTLERLLQSYGEQLAGFADELTREARRLGMSARDGGIADATPSWAAVSTDAGSQDDADIISACEQGEHLTIQAFRAALRQKLPAELGATLARQFLQVKEAHAHILTIEQHASQVH
jgi:uncharacterized protein (TIGR02284 family)